MNSSDFVPNLREFFFLRELYRAKKHGFALQCDEKPTKILRLVDAGLVDLTSPSIFHSNWELRLNDSGINCFIRCAWKFTGTALAVTATIAAAIIAIA